jgi:hypothetical protein
MTEGGPPPNATSWDKVARDKLCSVLGREQGEAVMAQVLKQIGLTSLATPDELHRFAQHVARLDGFIAAVGALLSLHAVMHGASGTIGSGPQGR